MAVAGWGPRPRKLGVGSASHWLPSCVREASHFTSPALVPHLWTEITETKQPLGLSLLWNSPSLGSPSQTGIICALGFPTQMAQVLNVPPLSVLTPVLVSCFPPGPSELGNGGVFSLEPRPARSVPCVALLQLLLPSTLQGWREELSGPGHCGWLGQRLPAHIRNCLFSERWGLRGRKEGRSRWECQRYTLLITRLFCLGA